MGDDGEPGLNGTDGRIGIPGMQVYSYLINLHWFNLQLFFLLFIFFYCSFFSTVHFNLFFSTVHVNYSCLPFNFSVFHCNSVMLLSINAGSPWSRRSDGSER